MSKLYCVKFNTIDKAGLMEERYRNKARLIEYDLESVFDDEVYDTLTSKMNDYYRKADIIQEALANVHGQNRAEWKYIEVLKQAEIELQLSM